MDQTEQLLRAITEVHGIPGYETEVSALVRDYFQPLGAIEHDRIGSVVCRQGESGPRILIAGHMDEIGFMVHHITKEGFLRFVPLGGWWDQVLLGQRVIVKTHKGDLVGTIGAKPPHLLPMDERQKPVEKKDMYIDIGVGSREDVEKLGIRVGDMITPYTPFRVMNDGKTLLGKAWDDRLGAAVAIEVLQNLKGVDHLATVVAAGTVQEEVGLRGARTAAYHVKPDVAFALDVTMSYDLPGAPNHPTKLGAGVALHGDKDIAHLVGDGLQRSARHPRRAAAARQPGQKATRFWTPVRRAQPHKRRHQVNPVRIGHLLSQFRHLFSRPFQAQQLP
mgnify:CR=1 FL=1